MNWAVGVTTAPRKQPTLNRCLESLVAAGWTECRVFSEPGVSVPKSFMNVSITTRDQVLGPWSNWLLGLSELFHRQPHADVYMMVQDDAVFCRNVRPFLEYHAQCSDNIGVLSPYCPADYASEEIGFHTVPADWRLIGALTYIVPASSIESLLTHPALVTYRRDDPRGGIKHIDSVVGRWAQSVDRNVFYFSPSLVQHVGDTSTIDSTEVVGGSRQAAHFVGGEFNAMALLEKTLEDQK